MGKGFTLRQAAAMGIGVPARPKRNKYRVSAPEARTLNGRVYASKAEMLRASELAAMLDAGTVIEIVQQPRLSLGVPENVYVPDFLVIPSEGLPWYEDVKGVETATFRRNVRLWKAYGRLDLIVLKGGRREWSKTLVRPAAVEARTR